VPLAFLLPVLFEYRLLLAGIVFIANTGQGMASLLMVLVPTESVPAEFRATSIGLVTSIGEIAGATTAPLLAGVLAEKYGLSLTMWLAAAGSAIVFVIAIFLRETAKRRGVTGEPSRAVMPLS